MLTVERVRELFIYEKETGLLRWAVKRQRISIGKIVGSKSSNGYLKVGIDFKNHFVHRIVWMVFHGEIPSNVIDHINGNKSDNRIENLRIASPTLNNVNRHMFKNKCGLRGIKQSSSGKWQAAIKINRKSKYLGTFPSKEEAYEAYKNAANTIFGEFVHSTMK
jgi:hypothetical protein